MAKTPENWNELPEFVNEFVKKNKENLDKIKNTEFKNYGNNKGKDKPKDDESKNDDKS